MLWKPLACFPHLLEVRVRSSSVDHGKYGLNTLREMHDDIEGYHEDGVIDLICKSRASCMLLVFCSQSHVH
jgi:hypothetical protein